MGASILELLAIVIFFIAFYGLITRTNIIKSIVFVFMMESSVILFFLTISYQSGVLPPIGYGLDPQMIADPLPQALMITAVVIGLCGTAVNVIMFITLYRKYGTANWNAVMRKDAEQNKC